MKHFIKLEVELADLPDDERREMQELSCGSDCADPDDPDEGLPTAADISTGELADLIADYLGYADAELWAGSNMYARIVSVEAR